MAKKMPVALFIGRFQPFHKGHLSAVKWIAKKSSKVIVAIGSAQEKNTVKNPFSVRERVKMIKAQLSAAGLARKCVLASVTDIHSNELWVAHVDARVPRYDVVYSNNALVKKLMRRAGKTVRAVPFFKKEKFNATKIRTRMKKGARWQDRVPTNVKSVLKRIGAEARVKRL
ncbi:MAG: nicotinamide-nucleotide adenylyltransferase [Candidatus Micrarchaeota archaeon]|nr:nicotinamide-nucleotide adenylyltransferase [Candidatus Micrarchaeota archaeon]